MKKQVVKWQWEHKNNKWEYGLIDGYVSVGTTIYAIVFHIHNGMIINIPISWLRRTNMKECVLQDDSIHPKARINNKKCKCPEWEVSTHYEKGDIVIFNGKERIIGESGANNKPITIEEYARRNGLDILL